LNEEITHRIDVVRIFPTARVASGGCGRWGVDTHENCLEQYRYLNMDDPRPTQKGGAAPCRLTPTDAA
jgi:hypothetical protein